MGSYFLKHHVYWSFSFCVCACLSLFRLVSSRKDLHQSDWLEILANLKFFYECTCLTPLISSWKIKGCTSFLRLRVVLATVNLLSVSWDRKEGWNIGRQKHRMHSQLLSHPPFFKYLCITFGLLFGFVFDVPRS